METKSLMNAIGNMLQNSIRILKDEDYQRKVWFRDESTDVSCYTETVSHFLRTSGLIIKDPNCIVQLGEQNFSLLEHLHYLIKEHRGLLMERIDPDCMEENELLDDPNWQDIQTLSEDLFIKLTDFVTRRSNE